MLVSPGLAIAQATIRDVDFKNFTYPLSGALLGHNRLQWLGQPGTSHPGRDTIRLVNGENLTKLTSFVVAGQEYTQWAGFTLQSVDYADVTGNGKEGAIVVLLYQTGGTQTTHYVYVYSLNAGKPKLLAYCHTGSRADFGLNKVYGERGMLVFELLDPAKSSGDCCSSGIVRTRYRWHDGRFEPLGTSERETLKEP
jgi:hypothetical protein